NRCVAHPRKMSRRLAQEEQCHQLAAPRPEVLLQGREIHPAEQFWPEVTSHPPVFISRLDRSDSVKLTLEFVAAQLFEGQGEERTTALLDPRQDASKGSIHLAISALHVRGIRQPPVGLQRRAEVHRTGLAGSLVADRDGDVRRVSLERII